MTEPLSTEQIVDKAKGCLLGGAIGDALGAPVEFMNRTEILEKFGPDGIQEFAPAFGKIGAITDDTQMTLFTAEGLIRAVVRGTCHGVCNPPSVLAYAYQRWLDTQGDSCHPFAIEADCRGWLVDVKDLRSRRAPGNTCLTSLQAWAGGNGELEARNDSKGCGTVMRSAPFAFFPDPWKMAWESAAITHGNIEAKAAAAMLAVAIHRIVHGSCIDSALLTAVRHDENYTLSSMLVLKALELAESDMTPWKAINQLGQGWVAEEAFAIASYCAVKSGDDFERAARMAVNHDGDSDSTGAICGNLVGASLGAASLPSRWLDQVELKDVIETVAIDMGSPIPKCPDYERLSPKEDAIWQAFWKKYPGC